MIQIQHGGCHVKSAHGWHNAIRSHGSFDLRSFGGVFGIKKVAGRHDGRDGFQAARRALQQCQRPHGANGRSLLPLLQSSRGGRVDPTRDHVLLGRERNDIGRPNDEGYPIRGWIDDHHLYLRNFEPGRWPAGNPETGQPRHPLLAEREERTALLIVVTGDKGLAGAFNTNINKAALRFLEEKGEGRWV